MNSTEEIPVGQYAIVNPLSSVKNELKNRKVKIIAFNFSVGMYEVEYNNKYYLFRPKELIRLENKE